MNIVYLVFFTPYQHTITPYRHKVTPTASVIIQHKSSVSVLLCHPYLFPTFRNKSHTGRSMGNQPARSSFSYRSSNISSQAALNFQIKGHTSEHKSFNRCYHHPGSHKRTQRQLFWHAYPQNFKSEAFNLFYYFCFIYFLITRW